MKDLEREFEQMVRANRGTIYTVCYMFSNDQDEVADLFQEVLINLFGAVGHLCLAKYCRCFMVTHHSRMYSDGF